MISAMNDAGEHRHRLRPPLAAPWVTNPWVDQAFEHQRRIDPFGHRVHTALAALACLCLAGPTSVAELGAIPLVAAFAIRMHRHWRTWPRLFLQPLMLTVLAWTLLGLASRLWPHAWAAEFGVARFGVLLLALWPVADRRALLLAALAAGFALGQLSQLSHALGTALDWPIPTWNRLPGRNSGWWDPVVGGSLLTAALGLHLPAALWGKGLWRTLGIAGAATTLLGILATGTRGAWLAGAALIALALLGALLRLKPRRRMLRAAGLLLAVLALGAALAWLTIGDQLASRYRAGRDEIAGAIEHRQFQSDTGTRMLMAWWACEALAEHPLTGVGLGGFEAWTRAHVAEQGIDPATRNYHAHAHNALLQTGATLGVPGLLLALAFIALALTGAARRQPGAGPPGPADGPLFALLGLLLVSAFDSVQVNSQTCELLMVLLLFAMQARPTPPRPPTESDQGSRS